MFMIFNNDDTKKIKITSYSRNRNFDVSGTGTGTTSFAYMDIDAKEDPVSVTNINEFGDVVITSIEIINNQEQSIYELTNITGKLTSINESITEEYMTINANMEIKV